MRVHQARVHLKIFSRIFGRNSHPSKEALFAIAAFERLLFEQLQVFERVGQGIAGVGCFAVFALAYTARMVLVAATPRRQAKVGSEPASFAMAVPTLSVDPIVLWDRRPDAEGFVAAGRAAFACVGGWAVERLTLGPLALLALLCERRVRVGGIRVCVLWRSFSAAAAQIDR